MNKRGLSFVHGLSRKKDGNMKMSGASCDSMVLLNRQKFLSRMRIKKADLVVVSSEHKNKVKTIKSARKKHGYNCDALLSDRKDVILGVTVADCLPIYFFDKKKKVVGIAHAGWRGLLAGVVEKVVIKMIKDYKSQTEDISVIIGPHIQRKNYEIGRDIACKFGGYKKSIIIKKKKFFLDLSNVAVQILTKQGIRPANIDISKKDTYADKKCFSFRRDKPVNVEAMLAYIKLL
jgi:hypothetical protein